MKHLIIAAMLFTSPVLADEIEPMTPDMQIAGKCTDKDNKPVIISNYRTAYQIKDSSGIHQYWDAGIDKDVIVHGVKGNTQVLTSHDNKYLELSVQYAPNGNTDLTYWAMRDNSSIVNHGVCKR